MENSNLLVHVFVINTAKDLLLAGGLGFITVFINSYYGNYWLRQKNTLIMAWILPAIALVITKVIATNFALSLGMIGALSIIRYRTPVKSNYELALLFGLITIGITTGVNTVLATVLTVFICLIPFLVFLLQRGMPGFLLTLPYTSEGKVECTFEGVYEDFDRIEFPEHVLKSVDVTGNTPEQGKTFIAMCIFPKMQEATFFLKGLEKQNAISSFSFREI